MNVNDKNIYDESEDNARYGKRRRARETSNTRKRERRRRRSETIRDERTRIEERR